MTDPIALAHHAALHAAVRANICPTANRTPEVAAVRVRVSADRARERRSPTLHLRLRMRAKVQAVDTLYLLPTFQVTAG